MVSVPFVLLASAVGELPSSNPQPITWWDAILIPGGIAGYILTGIAIGGTEHLEDAQPKTTPAVTKKEKKDAPVPRKNRSRK